MFLSSLWNFGFALLAICLHDFGALSPGPSLGLADMDGLFKVVAQKNLFHLAYRQ